VPPRPREKWGRSPCARTRPHAKEGNEDEDGDEDEDEDEDGRMGPESGREVGAETL
jgi:hypothetical protein